MIKCALSVSHSNADIERSLSINKRMLTKKNMTINDETFIGLRATTSAENQCGEITTIPKTKELLKVTEQSHNLYQEYKRQE